MRTTRREFARTRRDARNVADCCARCKQKACGCANRWKRTTNQFPRDLVQAPEHGGAPWGWITALGLSAGGAYTAWSGFIEPWRAQAAQAGFTQGNLLTMLFFSGAFWKGWDAMRSLIEFLAMATLGLVVMWLLRRHLRRTTALAVVMGALALMVALPPSAGAAELRHGDPNYSLPAGEVIHTDLIVSADSTRIDGDVEGDLITFSRSVTVNGHIKGDIIAFSQELRVNGPVDGNVRAFVQNLQLYRQGGAQCTGVGRRCESGPGRSRERQLTAGSGHLEVNGKLVGDLLAFSGDVDINGQLGRNARIRAGHLTIGSRADIAGQTTAELRQAPEVSTSAKLGSPLDWKITQRDSENRYSSARYYVHQILKWGASFLFGLVLLFLMPGFFFDAVRACNKTAPAIGFGLLLLPGVLLAAVIMCITIVGLGVGISALLLWLIAIYAAQVLVGAWLGEKVLGASAGVGAALGRLALGLAILRVLGMLPYLGWWISFVAVIWGIGAVALASYKNMRPQVAAAVAAV